MRFDELNLSGEVLAGISDAGFATLTPIQELALPLALSGRDVAGQAQTGTGKTAAFLVSIFNRIKPEPEPVKGRAPRAIVIAPTRELAVQILADAELLGRHTGLGMMAVYGGVDYQKQKEKLEAGTDLLIGTPGRLIDYFKQKVFSLKYIEVVVIDEADRMFDMGFIADIRYMLRRMPPFDKRQSMLFSATLSYRVMELAYEHMNNPEKLSVTPEQMTVEKIEQTLFHVGRHEKFSLLLGVLKKENPKRAMLFINTKREAERVVFKLKLNGYESAVLSGDIPQNKRLRILSEFKSGKLPILVATDVASRGLHVEDVTHVFNYDLPQDAEDYVHRIGRTARAGASGKTFAFADEQYVFSLEEIEKYIGAKIPVSWPDEDMFVKEVRPTAEQRREFESGRASAKTPGGREPAKGGGGKSRRGPKPDKKKQEKTAAPKTAQKGSQPKPEGAGEAAKKRRRRRRKKPSGPKPEPAQ
jgi:ATP-dependent RNA helicase RhlB